MNEDKAETFPGLLRAQIGCRESMMQQKFNYAPEIKVRKELKQTFKSILARICKRYLSVSMHL